MTTRKGTTKRQHYVPQMILRKFSANESTVSLLVLRRDLRVDSAPINRQCYEDYFYGADQVMEESFRIQEDKVAAILGDLSRQRLTSLRDDDLHELKLFLHYQYARTRGAAESLSNFGAAFVEAAIRGSRVLNGGSTPPRPEENVRVRMNSPQEQSIWLACKTTPMMLDLAVKFLVTERGPGFVIADHPVVTYNQFAEHHPTLRHCPTSSGLALKGIQLFMPLSSSVTLAVYDPATYQYGGRSIVSGLGPQDVRFLNCMQAVSAWECLFFDARRSTEQDLTNAATVRNWHPSLYVKRVTEGPIVKYGDSSAGQFVAVDHVDIRIGAKLSFVRTLDGHEYRHHGDGPMPVRSESLVEFAEHYGRHIEAMAMSNLERKSGVKDG
jgi:hypothetical protein